MIEIASIMQELMNNTGMMFSSLGSHYIFYCSVQTFSHHIFYCSVQAFLSDSDCL